MLFPSFLYILVFLPVVVLGAILLRNTLGYKAAQAGVLLASFVFYGKSNPFGLIYLVASIIANWLFAHLIARTPPPRKKHILVTALVLNMLYLCVFKYLAFFASIVTFALPRGYHVPTIGFVLGISFFTITQIMYLVDCYEDTLTPGTLFDHASFVAFFPYLISGPLGRAKRIRHQFPHMGGQDDSRATTMARGVFIFSLGLFKKTIFGDAFAQVVTYGNTTATHTSALEAWIFSIAYALYLYFDFGGYTDMAIGSALMLGIDIPRNFDAPYSSKSIIEFWQRWHISLTNFITTYLFTPIFRSFKNRTLFASTVATFIAMGIAGLWHGGAWTYVVYGLLHGTYLGVNQYWRKKNMPKIPIFLSWLLTFVAVVIAQVYFQAASMHAANARVLNMFNPHHAFTLANVTSFGFTINGFGMRLAIWPLLLGAGVAFFGPSSEQRARDFRPTRLNCAYAVGLTIVSLVVINSVISAPFVYFKF